MFHKPVLIALTALFMSACTTNSAGQKVVDPNVLANVQLGVQLFCGFTPTAEAVAAIYTNNADVKDAESAIALLCAVLKPAAAK